RRKGRCRRSCWASCGVTFGPAIFTGQRPDVFSALALRAKMGAALREDDAFDGSSAFRARLAGAPVDAVRLLKASLAPFGVNVVRDGRSAARNRFREHLPHR